MNSPASIRARLLNVSRKSGEDFQAVLSRYAVERFLYRLGQSGHQDSFIVKGAMLFVVWQGDLHRPTKDLDLLGFGDPDPEMLGNRFGQIAAEPADDGIDFDPDSVAAEIFKEDAEYEGVRVRMLARLDQTRIPLQIDVGYGDAVHPRPERVSFPILINGVSAPIMSIYPKETVVAEKLQAMVALDIRNSRMKDFFDLWYLLQTWPFELEPLSSAIRGTFARRRTPVPDGLPFALTPAFLTDKGKLAQWSGFLKRLRLERSAPGLAEVGEAIGRFVLPAVLQNAAGSRWFPGGPWGTI